MLNQIMSLNIQHTKAVSTLKKIQFCADQIYSVTLCFYFFAPGIKNKVAELQDY